MNKKRNIGSLIYIVILIAIAVVIFTTMSKPADPKKVTFSELIEKFENDEVKEFIVEGSTVRCKLKDDTIIKHKLVAGSTFDREIIEKYAVPNDIKFDIVEGFTIPWWVSSLLPMVLLIGTVILFYSLMSRQMNGKGMSFAKARVKMGAEEKSKKTFADVAGAEEEK